MSINVLGILEVIVAAVRGISTYEHSELRLLWMSRRNEDLQRRLTFEVKVSTALARHLAIALNLPSLAFITKRGDPSLIS